MTGIHAIFPRSSFVGFDHLFKELDHTTRHANDHYPPHNILKIDENQYLIELAVAGFSHPHAAALGRAPVQVRPAPPRNALGRELWKIHLAPITRGVW